MTKYKSEPVKQATVASSAAGAAGAGAKAANKPTLEPKVRFFPANTLPLHVFSVTCDVICRDRP